MTSRDRDDHPKRIEHAARRYFVNGFALVLTYPIAPDGRCSCHEHCDQAGKHPINGKIKGALRELPKLLALLKRYPGAGLGILTGKASGLVVIDVDPRHGGRIEDTGTTLRVYHHNRLICELSRTLIQRTGGGGWHLVYRYRDGIQNGALAPDKAIDLLSDGACIVAAPTVHKSGNRYQWLAHDIAPCPDLPPTIKPKPKPQAPTAAAPITNQAGGDVRAVISALLIDTRKGRRTYTGEISYSCTDHDDERPSATWNEAKGTWFCHRCDYGGGFLSMAERLGIELRGPGAVTRTRATSWLAWIMAHQWRGMRGTTTRQAALWIARDFLRSGQATRRYSERHLADALSIGRNTAARALATLTTELRFMRCVRPAKGPVCKTFALLPTPGHHGASVLDLSSLLFSTGGEIVPDTGPTVSETPSVRFVAHDAFRNQTALGKSCHGVLCELERCGSMSWAELLQYHPVERTVRRWLTKLGAAGLVTQSTEGEWVALPVDRSNLDALAKEVFDTAGAGRRQADRHVTQRVNHRERIGRELLPDGTMIDTTTGEEIAPGYRRKPMVTVPPTEPLAPPIDWQDLESFDEPMRQAARFVPKRQPRNDTRRPTPRPQPVTRRQC